MKNFITDFDLVCENKFNIGLIGSMYFFGEAFGSLIYILFATSLHSSRVNHVILKNTLIAITLTSIACFLRSLVSLYVSIFIIGFAQAISLI